MFRSRNKEHESNKDVLLCLLDALSVFLWRTLAISALFQWIVGSLFSLERETQAPQAQCEHGRQKYKDLYGKPDKKLKKIIM